MVNTVGFIAFLITVIYTCLGLPAQIRQNYRKKSTAGISPFTFALLSVAFSSWVVYGALKKDWYILGSNFPGAVFGFTILAQCWLYRKK